MNEESQLRDPQASGELLPAREGYPEGWLHATIHLNPQYEELHSDGDHRVRHWITEKLMKLSKAEAKDESSCKELNSALSQLTEAESRLAEKDKEIAALSGALSKISNHKRDDTSPEVFWWFVKDVLRQVQSSPAPPYIHTDKVKPLVEALHNLLGQCDQGATFHGITIDSPSAQQAMKDAEAILAQYKEATGE